jgi:hypothetical protein
MVPAHDRAQAYGIFTAIFGIAWFAGSVVQGHYYDVSKTLLAGLSSTVSLLALVPLVFALRELKGTAADSPGTGGH